MFAVNCPKISHPLTRCALLGLTGYAWGDNLQRVIQVYAEHIDAPRLQYILKELLHRRLGLSFALTSDIARAHINYSHRESEGAIQVKPTGLLYENNLRNQTLSVKHDAVWDTLIWEQHGDIPFDVFAASFYLISRYEEYLPHKVDDHGRFDPEQSAAVQYGFLDTPLVDKWAQQLGQLLRGRFGMVAAEQPRYRFISTFDIDTAYLYKGLDPKRQLKKALKAAGLFRFGKLREQWQVINDRLPDPYDTYAYLAAHTRKAEALYFILSGGRTEFDEQLPLDTAEMQLLLKQLGKRYAIGLHPSYATAEQPECIQREKKHLEGVLKTSIHSSRQHFLRFHLPQTYRDLLKSGITADYSMGYSSICGFRASTCFPFAFYDLEQNSETPLVVYPTTVMDVTLRFHMNLSATAAIARIDQLLHEVKLVNGCFVSLWHNSSLSNTDDWLPWREVFEHLHQQASV